MKDLKALVPHLDEIMEIFYREMLSHEQLSVFFKDEHAIGHLIERQKSNFISSLDDDPAQLEARFRKLGELHFKLRVPSTDFQKGTSIWRRLFNDYVINVIKNPDLVLQVEGYFRKINNHMAHGYLGQQLYYDILDLDQLIERYQGEFGTPNDTIDHLNWLRQILLAIKHRDISLAPELDSEACQIHQILKDPPEQILRILDAEYFYDLHERLHIDSKSLFYFIENGDYPEVLSLYPKLLSVYKITLIMLANLNLQETIHGLEFQLESQKEKEGIYVATVRGAQHILNNLLQRLQLVKMEIDSHPDFRQDVAEKFILMIEEASDLVQDLSSVKNINESEIADSVGMREKLKLD